MAEKKIDDLSRRERQIMDIVYRNGKVSAAEVQNELKDSISYSAVRTMLKILEDKGFLNHVIEGQKYIYSPAVSKKNAMKHALTELLNNFFNNSVEQAVSALLEHNSQKLKPSELDQLSDLIEKARQEDKQDE